MRETSPRSPSVDPFQQERQLLSLQLKVGCRICLSPRCQFLAPAGGDLLRSGSVARSLELREDSIPRGCHLAKSTARPSYSNGLASLPAAPVPLSSCRP